MKPADVIARCRAGETLVLTQTPEGPRWHLEPSADPVDDTAARRAADELQPLGGNLFFGALPQQWGGGNVMSIVIVSDHAVVRYLERGRALTLAVTSGGRLDIPATREAIAAVCARGAVAQAPRVIVDGVRFVLRPHDSAPAMVVVTAMRRWGEG